MMKTIQQEEIYIPAFDYKDGRFSVRTEVQTWNTIAGGKPELVKTTVHRGVIETNPELDDDGSVNAEGLTITERNKRGQEQALDALAQRVGLVAPMQTEKIIKSHEAQKRADDDTIAQEQAACAQHLATIAALNARIAELESVA